ncbi:MFS transporter [Nocardia gipuzkoensis]|uniref:MFS transporter n=1 Tax=Nocardia gipuzkoensis TaxID=2749991 RepID=UPI001E4F8741|nr:MFS transporter [Nocardia gipuzkoensis]UGT67768.1 MFS transporter [Nocardia gipuzkoensis]
MNNSQLTGNRSFFLLWTGNALSLVGFHGARIAYPLLILATTDSLAAAGWVGFALGAPNLIFPILSGIIADRFERLRILMICQVVGLLAACVVATAVLAEARHLAALVLAAAFVEGAVNVFAEACELGAISDVVSLEQRPLAFAFLEAEQPIALLLGRAAGGAIFGLARWLPFIVDAATYLYCLIALALIRPNRTRRDPVAPAPRPRSHDLGAGIRVVWREPLLRVTTAALGMSNLIIQIVLLLILFELQTTGHAAWTAGVVLSSAGIGGILGAACSHWFTARWSARWIYRAGLWGWTGLLLPIASSDNPIVLAVCWGGVGAVGVVSNIALTLYRTAVIPEHMLGRALAAMGLVSSGAVALGALAAGYLLAMFGSSVVGWLTLTAMLILAIGAGYEPGRAETPLVAASKQVPEIRWGSGSVSHEHE